MACIAEDGKLERLDLVNRLKESEVKCTESLQEAPEGHDNYLTVKNLNSRSGKRKPETESYCSCSRKTCLPRRRRSCLNRSKKLQLLL